MTCPVCGVEHDEPRAVPGAGFVIAMTLIVGFVAGACFGSYMTWPVN